MLLLPLVLLVDEDDQHEYPDDVGGNDIIGKGVETVSKERAEPRMEGFDHDQHYHQLHQEEAIKMGELPIHQDESDYTGGK